MPLHTTGFLGSEFGQRAFWVNWGGGLLAGLLGVNRKAISFGAQVPWAATSGFPWKAAGILAEMSHFLVFLSRN